MISAIAYYCEVAQKPLGCSNAGDSQRPALRLPFLHSPATCQAPEPD